MPCSNRVIRFSVGFSLRSTSFNCGNQSRPRGSPGNSALADEMTKSFACYGLDPLGRQLRLSQVLNQASALSFLSWRTPQGLPSIRWKEASASSQEALSCGHVQCRFDQIFRIPAGHDFEGAGLDHTAHVAIEKRKSFEAKRELDCFCFAGRERDAAEAA
jgi:hypothetical protein